MKLQYPIVVAGIVLQRSNAFQPQHHARRGWVASQSSSWHSHVSCPLWEGPRDTGDDSDQRQQQPLHRRFNTLAAAELKDGLTAGGGGIRGLVQTVKNLPHDVRSLTWRDIKPIKRIKGLHGPITYIVLAVLFANKYTWMWRNPAWWFGIAFCIKWFRARYVFKIPVWDRQPNWNNIITSKEQEKDLKAFTCKNCGSTIFIAKTREFFFEGSTGIGGLGCFACGAKGADNFVMDRDRIVEDVADIDDYFEYERPLDFISAAERRALLKEAKGDEDIANQILVERTNALASTESQAVAEAVVNGSKVSPGSSQLVPEAGDDTEGEEVVSSDSKALSPVVDDDDTAEAEQALATPESSTSSRIVDFPSAPSQPVEQSPTQIVQKPKEKKMKSTLPPPKDDDFDFLGMDD